MSADAVGWTFRHSPFRGSTFAVHLAIADSVNDQNENEFWMAQANLAVKARVSTRTVRDAVGDLAEAGMMEPVDPAMLDPEVRARAGGPVRWRFLFPDDARTVYDTRRRTPAKAAGTPEQVAGVPGQDPPGTPAEVADVTQENPSLGTQDQTQRGDSVAGEDVSARRPRARRSDPRADPLTREWWERQNPRPAQSFVAARGVVSNALKAGWSEEELRRVLARCDPPLAGGRLDYVRSRMRSSPAASRPVDEPWDPDEATAVISRGGSR